MENLSQAFLLLAVGMTTVFCVLMIVICLSKGIICFVNKFIPEPIKQQRATTEKSSNTSQQEEAIRKAIALITGGKGQVLTIHRTK